MKAIRVVAFNGSPRKDGNTFCLINHALKALLEHGFGREKGEVEKDQEGIKTMQVLGENMAWLLKRVWTIGAG